MAAAILSIEGAPLTFDDLHQRVGRGAPGSLRNQVSTDPTFTKVDREHFALAEWGMDGYTNIRGEIGKLLDQAGGELPLASVVDSLVDRFAVSPNSVAVYAAGPPFQLLNGTVRNHSGQLAGRGRTQQRFRATTGEEMTGSIARLSRSTTSAEADGRPRQRLSTILGMSHGEYAEAPSRLGPEVLATRPTSRRTAASDGSLKTWILASVTRFSACSRADGTFDVERLPDAGRQNGTETLRSVGAELTLDVQEAIEALGAAPSSSPPGPTSVRWLRATGRVRRSGRSTTLDPGGRGTSSAERMRAAFAGLDGAWFDGSTVAVSGPSRRRHRAD